MHYDIRLVLVLREGRQLRNEALLNKQLLQLARLVH
jgi:hypothetical protein